MLIPFLPRVSAISTPLAGLIPKISTYSLAKFAVSLDIGLPISADRTCSAVFVSAFPVSEATTLSNPANSPSLFLTGLLSPVDWVANACAILSSIGFSLS